LSSTFKKNVFFKKINKFFVGGAAPLARPEK